MLIKFAVSALVALASAEFASVEPDSNLTTDQGVVDARSDEYVCLSEAKVESSFEGEEEEEEPLTLYCLAECKGEHARPGFVPVAGPATPAEIVAAHPYWDPYKWCAFVAKKACRNLGPDHKLSRSCFGSRL